MSGRAILRGLPALSLGVVMTLAVGYTWLQTTVGKRWLVDWIETVVSTSERQLTIGTLDGAIPFAPTVTGISLSDSEGTWLTLDRASIRLDPLALLNRVALFEVVDVGRVVMQRQPSASSSETEEQPAERPPWPLNWPELPVDLEIERLRVTDVALGPTVLGEAASFGVEGAMRLGDLGDGLSLDLAVVRTDGSSGSLSARLRYIPDTTRLVTKLRLSEPAGGMLSRLADLPALPELNVDLVGDGTLDDWEAELRIDGGDDLRIEAMATILEEGTGRRVVVDATSRLADFADVSIDGLYPGDELPSGWLEPSTRIEASGSITREGMIVVDSLTVDVPAARLSVAGTAEAWGADGVHLAGTVDVPDADFTASGVMLAASRELGIGGVEIATILDWDGRALNLESTIKGDFDGSINASASVAAPMDSATGLPIVDDNSNLTGRISGGARLEGLNDLLAARGDRVGGAVSADLSMAGSIADPRVGGMLELTEGSYRSALAGVSLSDIVVRLNEDGGRLTIAKLSATAPNGGLVAITGGIGIDPDAGFPAELSVRFDDALIINNDIVSAELAGTVGISGELMQSLAVAGRLTVVEAEIRLPERLLPSIPTLDVEEINVPPELAGRRPPLPARQTADVGGSPLRILLDLAIDAPQRIFVRGRGLDAEVAGEVTVRGDADAPDIGGGFELRRGFFNALGRRFRFDEGFVTLPQDGSLDADIRFVARTDVDDVAAQIIVSGRASAPRITVESVPDLPQDEILARILFGRRASSLTAFESVRLARSAAELAGLSVGPDVLGGVRGALGLDLIDIERQGDGVESSVLNLGTRIRDRLSVGVQHGLQAGSGRTTVQMELTPNISVETDVGVNSTGRLGVGMEWEY